MRDANRLMLKMISVFLQYPNESTMELLESVEELIYELPPERRRQICRGFLPYLKTTPLMRLREDYTRIFDLSPATCLNLTYHKWGDGKERGGALAQFHHIYKRNGYECVTGELPDYLPMVLEFLSICPEDAYGSMVEECIGPVEVLESRMQETGSPYADLFGVLMRIFRQ